MGDLFCVLIEIDCKFVDGCGKIRFMESKNGLCFDIDVAYMKDFEIVMDLNGFDLSVCMIFFDFMVE